MGATGALLWDSIEKFIAASCSYEEFSMDASMEAFILLEGLCLVDELRIYSVVVECDSMEIVHAILDPSEYGASGSVVTDDCHTLLSSFGRATIAHCAWESNVVAHSLAQASYKEE